MISDKIFKNNHASSIIKGDIMFEVTSDSKYMDLLNEYPLLKTDLVRKNYKFKFLVTPMGKISLWESNLAEVSEKAEMSVEETVLLFNELIGSY